MKQLVIIVCLFVFFTGCAALRPRPEPSRDVTYERPDDEREVTREEAEEVFDPSRLGRYDVGVIRAGGFETDAPLELTPYARATIFASMLETFDLVEVMTADQRRDFYGALFKNVPTGPDGAFRAVVIGHYFQSGEPLYILLAIGGSTVGGDVAGEAVHTLLYQSSALAGADGTAARVQGRFVDMTVNISWIYPVDSTGSVRSVEGSVVPITTARSTRVTRTEAGRPDGTGDGATNPERGDRESDEEEVVVYEEEASESLLDSFDVRRLDARPFPSAARERIRLAYRILDRNSAIDVSYVPRLVDSVFSDRSEEPWLRVEAGFAAFLYELFRGDLEAAEGRLAALSELTEYREQIGDRLHDRVTVIGPVLLEAIEYEVEHESEF